MSGQFQKWTYSQYAGRKPLRILGLPQRATLALPRKLSAPFRWQNAGYEIVPPPARFHSP